VLFAIVFFRSSAASTFADYVLFVLFPPSLIFRGVSLILSLASGSTPTDSMVCYIP